MATIELGAGLLKLRVALQHDAMYTNARALPDLNATDMKPGLYQIASGTTANIPTALLGTSWGMARVYQAGNVTRHVYLHAVNSNVILYRTMKESGVWNDWVRLAS